MKRFILILLCTLVTTGMICTLSYADYNAEDLSWKEITGLSEEQMAELTLAEKIQKCSVSNETLLNGPLEKLIDMALDYPLLCNLIFFDDIDAMISYFSRTSELLNYVMNQRDFNDVLLSKFAELQVDWRHVEQVLATGGVSQDYYKVIFIARLFSKNYINLSEENRDELLNLLSVKRTNSTFEKELLDSWFLPSFSNTINIENVILKRRLYSTGFSYLGTVVTRNDIQYQLGIYSKYGVSASCLKHYSGELTSSEKNNYNNTIANYYPSWQRIGEPTVKYNCHSYTWIDETTSNVYWLDSPSAYANSSSFYSVGDNCGANYGDYIIIFDAEGNIQHSAISKSTGSTGSGVVTTSKLGKAGVYRAPLADIVLLYGNEYTVYRKK